jgi:hypothetical protein
MVELNGLRGEQIVVTLQVVPVSSDTTERDDKLTEVVLAIESMVVDRSDYSPPQSASPPAPSTFVEMDGITSDFAFLPPDIDELGDGEHGSVALRKIPNHNDSQQGQALLNWMQQTIDNLVTPDVPYIDRRAMSLIARTGPDPSDEVGRINCFEIWPHELYLFNPAKSYPTAYLIDVSITTEYCQDAR